MTEGLLKLSTKNAGEFPKISVDLKGVVKEAVARVLPMAKAKQIAIHHQNLASLKIKGDNDSLIELVTILLDNAIKYSDEHKSIDVSLNRGGRYAYLVIKDYGQGIKPKDLSHIFDRFYRADTSRSKNKTNGYGLGLSIAKSIVERHSGEISVNSRSGKGSTFKVRLPLA
jgi:signal transduction histidine kinase